MILLLLIILFIIFLLYRFRQRTVEEYIIDSVDLSWRNKTGVEDVVNKWILIVKDKNNNEIHRTENSDSNNRKNETDVKLNVFSNKTFGDNIIGNNTIDIYYNEVSGDKKVNTQLLRFEKDEFTENLGSFEFRDLDMSAWENAQNADCEGIYSKVKKNKSTLGVEKFGCGPTNDPNKHWCQFWKHTHTQKQLGTGKACSRGDGHVIKVQWPKKTNTDRVGLQFVDDPNPNTDSKVADNPQHYKSLFDQQQAIVDAQEKENAKIAKEAADKAAAEAFGGIIPNQTKLGEDGWCGHGGVVIHQVDGDVNTATGCKRICSDTNQVWTRDTSYGLWDSNEANNIVNECTDAKLDIIWEKDGDGKRKLRSGFKASKDYVPPQNQSELPDEIYMIGGRDGKYCAVDGDLIKCNKSAIGIGGLEKFGLIKNSDGTYSFKGGNKYCADEGNRIICNRGSIGGWERFKISKNSDGTYSLTGGKDGKYCADESHMNRITCDRGSIGGWERFKIGKYNKPSLSLRAGNSGAQIDGGGKVYYLDRHNIECGSDALNGFGLIRQPGGKTQYNYLCLKPGHLTKHDKKTNSQYKGSKSGKRSSALYLDRHTVDCNNKPITQFRLHRDGSRRIYYKYKCGNVSTQNNACRETSTPWNQESSSVHYLDRHYAKCNPDEYMTKFKLNRRGNGQFRYDFRCCKKN